MTVQPFTSVTEDGLLLDGKLYLPNERPTKAIIHVHGWGDTHYTWQDGSPMQFVTALAETAGKKGYAFLSVNNRGYGLESKHEIFEDCVLDIRSYLDGLEEMGCSSVILEGHSTGANKVAHYEVATGDKRFNALSLLSPTDDVGLHRHNPRKNNLEKNLTIAREFVDMGKGTQIMEGAYFGKDISARSYYNTLNPSSCHAIFNYSTGNFRTLSEIQIPKLAVFGSNDGFQINPTPREALEMLDKLHNMRTVLIEGASHRLDDRKTELARVVEEWLKELDV